jgi:cytochrome P450
MRMQESIAGHIIPKGMDVSTCWYSIQHNPEHLPHPHEDMPDHGLMENQNEDQLKLAKKAFVLFSLEPRGCLGKHIAYMERTTAL